MQTERAMGEGPEGLVEGVRGAQLEIMGGNYMYGG